LGQRLRQALKQAGLTHADLASEDLTPVYIKMIEAGQVRPSLELLQELAERLGQPVSYFLEGLPGSPADVFLLLNLGNCYLGREDADKAAPLLNQAHKYAQGLRSGRLEGLVKRSLCRLCWLQADYEAAEKHGAKALMLLQEFGDTEDVVLTMMFLGHIAWTIRDPSTTLARYQDAVALAGSTGDQHLLRLAYANLGNGYFRNRDWERAAAAYEQAISLSVEVDTERQVDLETERALTARERGDLDRALEHSFRALAALEGQRRVTSLAWLYGNLGESFDAQGNRAKARECYERALDIVRGQGYIKAKPNLARLSLEEGKIAEACSRAQAALESAAEKDDRREWAKCALICAQASISSNTLEPARGLLLDAATAFEELGMRQSLLVSQDLLRHIASQSGDHHGDNPNRNP